MLIVALGVLVTITVTNGDLLVEREKPLEQRSREFQLLRSSWLLTLSSRDFSSTTAVSGWRQRGFKTVEWQTNIEVNIRGQFVLLTSNAFGERLIRILKMNYPDDFGQVTIYVRESCKDEDSFQPVRFPFAQYARHRLRMYPATAAVSISLVSSLRSFKVVDSIFSTLVYLCLSENTTNYHRCSNSRFVSLSGSSIVFSIITLILTSVRTTTDGQSTQEIVLCSWTTGPWLC